MNFSNLKCHKEFSKSAENSSDSHCGRLFRRLEQVSLMHLIGIEASNREFVFTLSRELQA